MRNILLKLTMVWLYFFARITRCTIDVKFSWRVPVRFNTSKAGVE